MTEKPKFAAGVGFDSASGLGCPNGTKLLAALQGGVVNPPPPPPPPPTGMTAAQFQATARQNLRKVFSADKNHEQLLYRYSNAYFAQLADATVAATPTA